MSGRLERFIYLFKDVPDSSKKDVQNQMISEEMIAKAFEEVRRSNWTKERLLAYEQAQK